MDRVQVLDCTLRDGGYCNQWKFGFQNIKKIVRGLNEANIEIVECGFLSNTVKYDENITIFTSIDQVKTIIPKNREGKLFVVMINYSEYDVSDLPEWDGTSIDGIRVAFHKKDKTEALNMCKEIKAKGYKVFVQPMVSLGYTDEEFLGMIHYVNDILPYAFYIVDSFGMMKEKELKRLFYMIENNLSEKICIGFHSHNNMQLAYSNAQVFVNMHASRNLIVDSSVYGMGRGAGNLNTEIFVEYLNQNSEASYDLKPLLVIIDEILNDFYQRNYWGYSLSNYLSASHNAHPNYAGYLDDKKTLTVKDINEIFYMMDSEKKLIFDKNYIEDVYIKYMETGKVLEERQSEFKACLDNKKVVLIAPGKSSAVERDKIIDFLKRDDVISISVNFNYQYADIDYIFLSNLRRMRELGKEKLEKCIVTSNIPVEKAYIQVKYQKLLNAEEYVMDNAGLMAIKLLIDYGAKEIYLAGFDGYSYDVRENYAETQMAYITRNPILDAMNLGMKKVLAQYKKQVKIEFLTNSKNIVI